MKRILNSLVVIFLLSGSLSAQWVELASVNGILEDLIVYDTSLFIGGNFSNLNGIPAAFSAEFDGTGFTTHSLQVDGTGIRRFGIYDFDLYATGFVDDDGLAQWDGTSWDAFGGFSDSHTGILGNGQELFVGSDLGNASLSVSGAAFTSLPILGQDIYVIDTFNGEVYVGGDFTSSPNGAVNRIARWDGNNWQPLAQGFTGGFGGGSVRTLASYKGQLYAGGIFTIAGTSSANGIARWDGSTWSDVGGSLATGVGNGVRDMVVFNDELYVVGDFTEIGGVTTNYVAKWDGSNWTGLDLDISSDFGNCVEVFEGQLYVGTFNSTESRLYQLSLMVGAEDPKTDLLPLQVVQNRMEDLVTVSWDRNTYSREAVVQVFDMQGHEVFRGDSRSAKLKISANGWGRGMYIITVSEGGNGVEGSGSLDGGLTGSSSELGAVLGRAKFLLF